MNIQKMLKEIGAQEVGIGGMKGMAVNSMQFIKVIAQLQEKVEFLSFQNEELKAIIESGILEEELVPTAPQYPADFYQYGNSPASFNPSDEEIQSILNDLDAVELTEGSFVELTSGSTVVIKSSDGKTIKYIVAKGYLEFVEDIEPEVQCQCNNPQECFEHGCQQ